MNRYCIVHYCENGHDIFQEWLDGLRDLRTRTAIARSIKRIEGGNFGVHRFCRSGVWELVYDMSGGYRVYYTMADKAVVLLLCGGDKSTQQKDIDKAVNLARRYKEEHRDEDERN